MKRIEHETEEHLVREDAAERLRLIADELSRHNELPFVRDGVHYTVSVPDEVTFGLEIEVGDKTSEIGMKLEWDVAAD
jgi:amphi-Trp domain-containing protein